MDLRDITISKDEIRLPNGEEHTLGPSLKLKQCKVISDCSEKFLIIVGLTMEGGSFVQTRTLKNFHFEDAHFKAVEFEGHYIGCDFGDWDSVKKASIKDCDFEKSILESCRFLNCDPRNIKFPKWPCFQIINPASAADYVRSKSWPQPLKVLLEVATDTEPTCVAACDYAKPLAKETGLSLDKLRELLTPIPGMQILD
jgi:hypothetical protein